MRYLRAGQSPKEVARSMNVSWASIQQIIIRHRNARMTFIETYGLRHPLQVGPPQKILRPLKQAEL